MSRFPDFWISMFPDFKISRIPGSQIYRLPDAAAPDELSDPNLTSLLTHPGIKYVARSPCCDYPN